MKHFDICCIAEPEPGPKWQALFNKTWPGYKRWFLKEGARARPSYLDCERAMEDHVPELLTSWRQHVELAGGGDKEARFLSLWCPTPFMTGCSQAVWTGDEPVLVRNYDFGPHLWEAYVQCSGTPGRRIVGMTDCTWGYLDGMNESGLVASLSFGGRRVTGKGFGIPLLMRYVLETCETAAQATAQLCRLPISMAYNITLLDKQGAYNALYLAPDKQPVVRRWPICTNHQDIHDWPEYLTLTGSVEREKHLAAILGDPAISLESFIGAFAHEPLFHEQYNRAYGTLYTAIYRPLSGTVEYRWKDRSIVQTFDGFAEGKFPIRISTAA